MTPTATPEETLGFVHFLAHADAVGLGLFGLLLCMSVLSWAVIVGRLRRTATMRRDNRRFLSALTATTDPASRPRIVEDHARRAPLARIASARHGDGSTGEAARGALQHRLDDEVASLEAGQTALASIASSAPFVGLFGTVWGIYHALLRIAATGQSSLDQVAGPIGEALIMTACGLAVAIPAGLAYNAFQRQIRLQIAELEKFADACLWRGSATLTAERA